VKYEPSLLVPWLKPIWKATDYACGRRLVAMLPEWIPAYEQYERQMPGEVRDKLLLASERTLDRLLEPLRGQDTGRSLTRPGTYPDGIGLGHGRLVPQRPGAGAHWLGAGAFGPRSPPISRPWAAGTNVKVPSFSAM
jgi:hypothetical protein